MDASSVAQGHAVVATPHSGRMRTPAGPSQVITDGGPNYATNYIALNIFTEGFAYSHMGYACAQSWIMLLIMAAITGIIFKTSSYWTFYEN